MELWFDASPSLPRRTMIPYLRFDGELVSDSATRKVSGFLASRLGTTTYHIRVGDDIWNGTLRAVANSCDGYLELSDLRTGRPISPNRLKAGFCVEL